MSNERLRQIRDEIQERAASVEDNTVHPGMPTMTGWITALVGEVVELRARVDDLEARNG